MNKAWYQAAHAFLSKGGNLSGQPSRVELQALHESFTTSLSPVVQAPRFDDSYINGVPNFEPDLVDHIFWNLLEKTECLACRAISFGIRSLLGNPVSVWIENEIIIGLCKIVLPVAVDWQGSMCKGIIDQQY